MNSKHTIATICLWACVCGCHTRRPEASRPCRTSLAGIRAYYTEILPGLQSTNAPFKTAYETGFPSEKNTTSVYSSSRLANVYRVSSPLSLIVEKSTGRVRQIWNQPLATYLRDSERQILPTMSVEKALALADDYMRKTRVVLPSGAQLAEMSFNKNYPGCWEVWWEPTSHGYRYDDTVEPYRQTIVIIFHEKYGFCGYGNSVNLPAPKSVSVRLGKKEAVARASRYAPLVMQTKFYQQTRLPGFRVAEVKSAVLRISVANWLLAPARAQWILKEIPKSTRLCWVVTFGTVDTQKRDEGMIPKPPDIVVYIDAATGENVGANFS